MADPVQPSNVAVAVATSALKAEQSRMRVIAENLANANSTSQTPGGDPYRRQVPVFAPQTLRRRQGRRHDPRGRRPDRSSAPSTRPATRPPTPRATSSCRTSIR